jgi:hypothetical protein
VTWLRCLRVEAGARVLSGPAAVETPEFQAMRGWYQFAPHVRSRTQVVVQTR